MFKYNAFISYSHAADGKFAPYLQSALQNFARPFYKIRALNIYRDQTNLSVAPELWYSIEKALDQADYFILLASPQAAQSRWVSKEIDHWLTIHRNSIDKFLIVLTEGEIYWDNETGDFDWERTNTLPRLLNWDIQNSSPRSIERVFKSEPYYIDMRQVKTKDELSLRNPIFLDLVATIAATLHKKSKSDMIGEDVSAHRLYLLVRNVAILLLIVLTIVTTWFAIEAIKQRNEATESYAGMELAEISRLRTSPINIKRTRRLKKLLVNINSIKDRPIYKTVQTLISMIPSTDFKKISLNEDKECISLNLNYAGDKLCVTYINSIEIWDCKKFKKLSVLSVNKLPGRASDGKIIWVKCTPDKSKIFFEVQYNTFALLQESLNVRFEGSDYDFKAKYLSTDLFQSGEYTFTENGGEREMFSLDFNSYDITFEGISKLPVMYKSMADIHSEIDYNYRPGVSIVDRVKLIKMDEDYSNIVADIIPDSVNNYLMQVIFPMNSKIKPSIELLAHDPDGKSAIYQVSQIASGMAMSGPFPVGKVPYIYTDKGELIKLGEPIFQQYKNIYNEKGFKPAALNFKMKFALLNYRIINFSKNNPRLIYKVDQDWNNVKDVRFTDEGTSLILHFKNGDISTLNYKTNVVNTFLGINAVKIAEISPDGQYIYILTDNNAVEGWEMKGFSKNGWSK